MSKMTKEYLKRKAIRTTVGMIEIKNPTFNQRDELEKVISGILLENIDDMQISLQEEFKGQEDEKMTEEHLQKLQEIVGKVFIPTEDQENKIVTLSLKMLTNIPDELIDDKDTIYDPSDDLMEVMRIIDDEILSKIYKKVSDIYLKSFTESLEEDVKNIDVDNLEEQDDEPKCGNCQKTLSKNNAYLNAKVCKECLRDMIDLDDIDSVEQAFEKADIPFDYKIWFVAIKEEDKKSVIGKYMKEINSLKLVK